MTTLYAPRPTGAFVLSEANGSKSRDAGILKSGHAYLVGELLVAEQANSVETGKWIVATAALLTAYTGERLALNYAAVDATSADQEATLFTRDCEVKASELTLGTGITASAAKAALATQGIIVR